MGVVYEIMAQLLQVVDDLIPDDPGKRGLREDIAASPLRSKRLKHSLPDDVLNVFNKVYSRRLDF